MNSHWKVKFILLLAINFKDALVFSIKIANQKIARKQKMIRGDCMWGLGFFDYFEGRFKMEIG
jgi:hypothetical protein